MVDFIKKHMRKAVTIKVFYRLQHTIVGKPQAVKTHVNGLVASFSKSLLYMLKHQGRLTRPASAHNADKRLIPVYFFRQISMESAICFTN